MCRDIRLALALGVLLWWAAFACGGEGPAEADAPAGPSITFLDQKAAAKAIADDSLDPYFSKLYTLEMSVKTDSPIHGGSLQEQRAECRRRYQAGVRAFTQADQDAARWFIERLHPVVRERYPWLASIPWSFIKVSNSIEGSLPHTRGKHIVISVRTCQQMATIKAMGAGSQQAARLAMRTYGETLLHEQIHVVQRLNPGLFDSLYTQVWKFEKAKIDESNAWLKKYHLVNPDGTDHWAYPLGEGADRRYIWPLVLLAPNARHMPDDFRALAISLEKTATGFRPTVKDNVPVFDDLDAVDEYQAAFPSVESNYHPNEIAADLISWMVMREAFGESSSTPDRETLLENLQKWCDEHLKQQPAQKADQEKEGD